LSTQLRKCDAKPEPVTRPNFGAICRESALAHAPRVADCYAQRGLACARISKGDIRALARVICYPYSRLLMPLSPAEPRNVQRSRGLPSSSERVARTG